MPGLVLAVTLVAVAPGNCGGYGKTSTAPSASTPRGGMCGLLTQARADTAAGESGRGGQQQDGQDGPVCYWRAANHNRPTTWVRVELIFKNTYDLGKLPGPVTAARRGPGRGASLAARGRLDLFQRHHGTQR